ncbi:MAG: ribbon-helix-helix domain-containing protein [Candidatus Nanohaloarchaea archaeon]|nr:ribbon-helix-helix domain-containing protein [Candidatus Nanohaloarchaea archaeon]
MSGHSSLSIPEELKEAVEELIEDTGFRNPSEFTQHVLRDIVAQGEFDGPEEYSETADKVRERLKELGYLEG